MMTLMEAIEARHSVRRYLHKPLTQDIVDKLQAKIDECNSIGHLHIQLVTNETKAFTGVFAYGKFSGVENYLVMAGAKDDSLDERIGYYGEQLVLLAQQLGMNTCWAGLSYRKVNGAYTLDKDEKTACMIALGYGETQGVAHKSKAVSQVSNLRSSERRLCLHGVSRVATEEDKVNADEQTPSWFLKGVQAALLAPTAINQQKFSFHYLTDGGRHLVRADKGFSLIGYTHMDLGIAKLHFEIGAGQTTSDDKPFEWV